MLHACVVAFAALEVALLTHLHIGRSNVEIWRPMAIYNIYTAAFYNTFACPGRDLGYKSNQVACRPWEVRIFRFCDDQARRVWLRRWR